MLPWDVCTIPKDEGWLGFIDVMTQGSIHGAKWVVRCLEGFTNFVSTQGACIEFWLGQRGFWVL